MPAKRLLTSLRKRIRLIRFKSHMKREFIDKIKIEGVRIGFVENDADHIDLIEYGVDFRVQCPEFRGRWVSIIAREIYTSQIVFGASVILSGNDGLLNFWKEDHESNTYTRAALSELNDYRGEDVVYIGYLAVAHSGKTPYVKTMRSKDVIDEIRRNMFLYIDYYLNSVSEYARINQLMMIIEPLGTVYIPHHLINNRRITLTSGVVGKTADQSRVTEWACVRKLKMKEQSGIYGLHSLGKVYSRTWTFGAE